MPGRLNIFQRTTLQWNELHPYNAVHCVEVPMSLDLEQLRKMIRSTLESHGLTGLAVDRKARTYQYRGGPAREEITRVAAGHNMAIALVNEIRRQLNTAFALEERIMPFRFFVAPANSGFFLGVSYLHVVAGAESIVLLMQDVVNAYLGRDQRGFVPPVEIYPVSYGPWLRRHPGVVLRKLLNLPSQFRKLGRSWRPIYRDEMDMGNGFDLFSLTPDQLQLLIDTGKSWGVTLNDLFLTLLLKILAPLQGHRAFSTRRHLFSVGSIVNIRKDMQVDSRRTFGIFLGSFAVTHAVPEGIRLRTLATEVHRQTQRIKQTARYMGAPVDLAIALTLLSFLSTERKKKFYQKHYPLWGGVTNMNLNTIWPQDNRQQPINYFRAVSTGPATPLVLSITTVRDIVNIGISFRSTVFSPADIEYVKNEFLKLLLQLRNPP